MCSTESKTSLWHSIALISSFRPRPSTHNFLDSTGQSIGGLHYCSFQAIVTGVRFSCAFFGDFECYRDFATIDVELDLSRDFIFKKASQFVLFLIVHSPLRNGKEREWRWKQGEDTLNLDPANDQIPR